MARKKKPTKAEAAELQQQIEAWTNTSTESYLIPVVDLIENDWNPNVMPDATYQKLKVVVKNVWLTTKVLPVPVVLRHHPTVDGKFQVIDGKHRKNVFLQYFQEGDKRFEYIPCVVGDFDDKTAKLLTSQLNYLKGEKDPEKYAEYLHMLNVEEAIPVEEMGELLPETAEEIDTTLEFYGLDPVHIDYEEEGDELQKTPRKEDFLEVKWFVSPGQYEIIQAEIQRISSVLRGKNIQGQALEYMAVMSSQTPLTAIQPAKAEELPPEEKPTLKQQKKKLREVGGQ